MAGYLVADDSRAPPELELHEVPLSLDFHPSLNVLATGMVDGSVRCSRFGIDGHEDPFMMSSPFLEGAGGCRSVRFSIDGNVLFAASADHSILGLNEAGAIVWAQPDAHRDGVSTLAVINETILASGDDSGAVKIWDIRQPTRPAMAFDVFQDYISDCKSDQANHPEFLLATSGDGTLACFDMRQGRVVGRSNELEEDILSMEIIKGGRKVVCGTSEGVLLVFSWDNWDGATDSFPGHPESVGALLKLDEQTVLTGSSDGLIRIVGIQPSKLFGLVGDHDGFPLERMGWSADRSLIGSISHDTAVRFWDVSYLHDDDDDDDEADGGAGAAEETGAGDQTAPEILAHLRQQSGGDEDDDWEDDDDGDGPAMSDDDDDDDDDSDDDDDDDAGGGGGGGGGRGGGGSGGGVGGRGRATVKTPAQSFFGDL